MHTTWELCFILSPFTGEKLKAMLLHFQQALQYLGIGYHDTKKAGLERLAVTKGLGTHILSLDRRLFLFEVLFRGRLLDCGVVSVMLKDRSSWLMPIRREWWLRSESGRWLVPDAH